MALSHFKQRTPYTCGPACLRMVLHSFGIKKSEKWLAHLMKTTKKNGTEATHFPRVARYFHLKSYHRHHASIADIVKAQKNGHEVIVLFYLPGLGEAHYSVVRKVDSRYLYLRDPWYGPRHRISLKKFENSWHGNTGAATRIRWFFAIKQ